MTEDRQEFATLMETIGKKVAPCEAAYTVEAAIEAAESLVASLLFLLTKII